MDDEAFACDLFANFERADRRKAEFLKRLAADTFLKEEEALVGESNDALLLLIGALPESRDLFTCPDEVA